ncbi:S-adenosyl-L-methionine-dependent methyltransferase [Quillaja saponaria]|uniref:S-adenosyl-L-methionine-dependent methyltransferase n=1 Tax=Quillaja saponaria TaxID=32244 RepID=A0AAD7L489_QUISA|nr:S-adenosyl-L-methionine-dependent methyltransferase [Quillaja saponaria]
MEWSTTSATRAYLDTLKLCKSLRGRKDSWISRELGSNEFVSALAAGMRAKLIVEVTSPPSTIALAASARQTGSRLVCILPEPVLSESKRVIKDSGLKDLVDFKAGDPSKLLPNYANIDFSLVDCKNDDYTRSIVVANNLMGERKGSEGHVKGKDDKVAVRSLKHPIWKGMEITLVGSNAKIEKRNWGGGGHSGNIRSSSRRKLRKSKWVVEMDEENGEEHIFRVPNLVG